MKEKFGKTLFNGRKGTFEMEEINMSVKVAINGFGRIGRLAFRQMFGAEGFEVVAINDLTSPKMLAHLLKYDSTQGAYAAPFGTHTVEAGEDHIIVDGKKLTIYAKANAAELPWSSRSRCTPGQRRHPARPRAARQR